MLRMNVPKFLWTDAVLTIIYLINRMPSTPLGGEVPIRHLRPNTELFPLSPKVFGCVAFVQDLSPGLDKLSPRSIKCMFIGYSRTQRGYRCFHPPSRRYLVSADVTFFESQNWSEDVTLNVECPLPSIVDCSSTGAIQDLPANQEIPLPLQVYRFR